MPTNRVAEVLKFWQDAGPAAWWKKNPDFDAQIKDQFGDLYALATEKKLDDWRNQSESNLALVLILDQFSRNLFRNSPKAFAQDPYALELAKHAVKMGYDKGEPVNLKGFYHLPYMHSEKLEDQELCVQLIKASGNEGSLSSAIEHRDIIAEFGRFPHRNTVLNRETTPSEQKFLDGGGFAG